MPCLRAFSSDPLLRRRPNPRQPRTRTSLWLDGTVVTTTERARRDRSPRPGALPAKSCRSAIASNSRDAIARPPRSGTTALYCRLKVNQRPGMAGQELVTPVIQLARADTMLACNGRDRHVRFHALRHDRLLLFRRPAAAAARRASSPRCVAAEHSYEHSYGCFDQSSPRSLCCRSPSSS